MKKTKTSISKFKIYEEAVQSPRWQVEYLPQFHTWLVGTKPTSMREDFSGTGLISCEWVKLSPKNRAVGLDLDDETLAYANQVNRASLKPSEQKRVQFLKQDVLKPTKEKFDWIGAYNFSFYTFHERKQLLKYFKAAHQSLKRKGTFFLELTGGEGFKETTQETKKFKIPGYGNFQSVWQQHQHDPISNINHYAIHFKLPNGEWLNDAFTYHWRIWEIREVREILEEAGFKKSIVLWENVDEDADEYLPQEHGDNRRDWLAYIVGVKS
jgi:SAM-dependent methyltransferase